MEKAPRPCIMPIIVPAGARMSNSDPENQCVVEISWQWIVIIVLAGFGLYALTEKRERRQKPKTNLGLAPEKSKTKRLFFMQRRPVKHGRGVEIVSIPRTRARKIIRESTKSGQEPEYDLFPIYAETADEARDFIIRGSFSRWVPKFKSVKPKQMTLFGLSANCISWDRWYSPHFDKEVWKCGAFESACKPKECAPKPKGSKARLRVCTDWTSNFSFHYGKDVRRCSKYAPICESKGCITSPAPKPEIEGEPSDKDIKALAKELAKEETSSEIGRQIKARGGIAPYKGGYLKEEYKEIPLHLKRKKGLPLDEMASELGVDEASLIQEIQKAYPKGRKKKRQSWKNFEDDAYRILTGQSSFGQYKEQELFPGLKREMVLELQDVAKSDDPLTQCLERKGWNLKRISDLRNSIIIKRQPDIFTGKTGKLTASEIDLEKDTDDCFKKVVARPTGPPKQMTLFGRSL